jgi:hypothetical protein
MTLATALVALLAVSAEAQPFEGPGTRAQGMGAFVAVADDASAVYWNPGGLASGSYFSLLVDRTDAEASPAGDARGGSRSSWLLALSAPVVGVSYYRLRSTNVLPPSPASLAGVSRVESLVTHHTGATLVHSLFGNLALGATVKLVRGISSAYDVIGHPDEVLDNPLQMGRASNRFDADVGVMAAGQAIRAGLTVRNLTEPEFDTGAGGELRLERQARAGIAVPLTDRWTAALDIDLTRNRGPVGDIRTLAIGAEGRVMARALVRGGVQFNTAGDNGSAPMATIGGSYAALGSLLVDAHFSTGSERGFAGWGLAGRVVF